MIKMPIFEIFKIDSARADREWYHIWLSYEQACMNDEIVELSSSETIRKLVAIMDEEKSNGSRMFDGNWIENPKGNFLNGYICLHVELKKHYRIIKKTGLYINGVKYVRYSCSAGNARNNNVFMVREDLYKRLFWNMACGVSDKIKVVKNKWSAYFGLSTSATYPIPEPRCCVVPDYKVDLKKTFDYVSYGREEEKYSIERKDMTVNGYCPYDGMGVADCRYMERVAEALDIDYVPSAMVIRNCWIKGCVATMDFKMFAEEVAGHSRLIKDMWGNEHDINDIDIILTESQFKLWYGYSSWQDYLDNLHLRNIGWGCTRVSPKEDKRHAFTNYQFLQVLDLDDKDIENICRPTLDWFNDILGNDVMKLVLYLCGSNKALNLDDIQDSAVKALIYNNDLINDNYIRQHVIRSLNKKIREAYTGKLIVDGNFSFMVSDPYGLLQYAMGIEPTGLLKDHEHYNGFWNERNVSTVAGMRSPLTHYSEVNILNLKKTDEMRKWYKWLDVGCTIFNIFGDDTFRSADSDFDGDLIMTTNQKEFIEKSHRGSVPITYPKKTAKKYKIKPDSLYQSDMDSFNSDIGYITNCSTSMYAMLENFDKDSEEYMELKKRLLITRKLQGDAIDKAKGIEIDPFPIHWVDERKCDNDFDKSLVIKKKPYFQKYIYSKIGYEYKRFVENMDNYSYTMYGIPSCDNQDKEFRKMYDGLNPVIDSCSVMNKLCHYLEKQIKEIKENVKKTEQDIVDDILIDYDYPVDFSLSEIIEGALKEYKQYRLNKRRKSSNEETKQENFYLFCRNLHHKVSSVITDKTVLANIVVYVCYEKKSQENRDFAWEVFGNEILMNVKKNRQKEVYLPVEDAKGDIVYLGKRYSRQVVNVGNAYFG